MNSLKFLVFVSLLFAFSCKNAPDVNSDSNELISTDVINNPSTKNSDQREIGSEALPEMSFLIDTYDFGEITQGEKVEYNFKFTNTGSADLVIASAKASCGCTVPNYPEEPVKPGEKSFITVTYDSNGRSGSFRKDITIKANTMPNTNKLWISGAVNVPD